MPNFLEIIIIIKFIDLNNSGEPTQLKFLKL